MPAGKKLMDCEALRGFARSVAEDPTRIALEHGPRRLSYGELDRWSDALARTLEDRGVPRAGAADAAGVAVALADPVERVVALLGAWKAGCVFVPIDREQPPSLLRLQLERIAPRWWIGDPVDGIPGSAGVLAGSLASIQPAETPVFPVEDRPGHRSDDLAYLAPTSGSTGTPKWVAGRYKGIGHFVRWEAELLGLGPGTRVSQLTSPYFDAWLRDVFVPLTVAGTLAIPETAEMRLDAEALAEWIDRAEIELVHCVPSLFHLLAAGDLHPRRFARLRAVLLAGEPPLAADLMRWFAVFGERVRIVNLYGPSETTMTKLFHEVRLADLERRSIPIGRPMPGAAALLVDGKDRPCAPGTVGEILLRTPYRSLGYYGRPAETAERFTPNPFGGFGGEPGDVVYRTGDLGRLLPDGAIEFLGRRDQQVKIRGQRIELAEVESALLVHPAVHAAAAVARPDADGLSTLWAFVVLKEEARETPPHEIRAALARAVPASLVPDRLVPVAELPRTRSGKLDRRALSAWAAGGRVGREEKIAPRTPTEERLVAIWREVIEVEESGVRDDFFAVGGHSLMATRLLMRVRRAFGVEVPLRDFLDGPTIEGLAEKIDEALLAAADPARIEEILRALDAEASAAAEPV
ncbi:MAG TPA: non-ribosomal peptide synthetase [Thermoanaerobaculia bacterium]|nr:non-ribosomal peptide synthetase [Thermoanaerobaculia bacterium]